LLWPTAVFVGAAVLAVTAAGAAGVSVAEIAEASWLVALQLWFLPVYLLLIALTPVMLAAHRRWGLAVPAVMAAAAGLVDAGVVGPHLHVIGYVNYLLVWGSIHQWGFAWQDRTLTRARWRPYALAAGGAALLAGLLMPGSFMADMVGSGNTNPPSIALLAFAAAQAGLVLAAEPIGSRLLARPRPWQRVRRLNAAVMTVYLWHFVPAIVIAVAFYPTGVMPQPAVGTADWWALRPAWLALLTVVLVPLVLGVMRAERPMLRLPAGLGPSGPWSPVLLTFGIAASMAGLARLAIAGFAPGGHLPVLVLTACAAGLVATLLTGRAPAGAAGPQTARPQGPQQLLADLLTPEEEELSRANVFDVRLLAARLTGLTGWLGRHPAVRGLPVGYFGASTGAAAALWAAASPRLPIAAIVSRGGRPDLAGPQLGAVRAPTLLIVGGNDETVLRLNRQAQHQLTCEDELTVIPGATHLFEEPGALEQVAQLAAGWFTTHLAAHTAEALGPLDGE
jgi:dienelactone hydrolase